MTVFLSRLLMGLILLSCSSTPPKKSTPDQSKIITEDLVIIKNDCDQNRRALACARYAYKVKNLDEAIYVKYVLMACDLGDDNSCFNLDQIKGKTAQYNIGILKREENQIFSCYSHYTEDIQSESIKMGETEHKLLNLTALINQEGKLQNMTLDGRKLNPKLEKCVVDIYTARKFIPADKEMLLNLTLVFPMKYKDTPTATSKLDGLADSLKSLK